MIMYGRNIRTDNMVPVKNIPYKDRCVHFQRPGWRPDGQLKRCSSPGATRGIILYVCYVKKDHYAPECTLTLLEQGLVLSNYESLDDTEKERVPRDSYDRIKATYATKDPMEVLIRRKTELVVTVFKCRHRLETSGNPRAFIYAR